MRDALTRLKTAVRTRGAAAFLLAALMLGVIVGLATAVLALLIAGVEIATE